MVDYYKVLNLPFDASETEIKKQFKKLAAVHHPDKNNGSHKSEEIFKIILNAYEILSNEKKRARYDFKYRQYFNEHNTDQKKKYNSKNEKNRTRDFAQKKGRYKEGIILNVNYKLLWSIFLIIILLLVFNLNRSTTTGNQKVDKELEQVTKKRPESGEINFEK